MVDNKLKELMDVIGDAYCRYKLSEDTFNYWLQIVAKLSDEKENNNVSVN